MFDPEKRKEGIQRIQIGLAGLTGMVLLVGLASIVAENVRKDEAVAEAALDGGLNAASTTPVEEAPKEPLAELGVTPAPDVTPPQPPVVADLQPDPNLREPMDRPSPAAQTVPGTQDPSQNPRQ